MKNNIGNFGRHLTECEQVVVDGITTDGAKVRSWGALTDFDDMSEERYALSGELIRSTPAYYVELNHGTSFVFREYEFHVPGTEPNLDDDEPAFELNDDDDPKPEPFPSLLAQHGYRPGGVLGPRSDG